MGTTLRLVAVIAAAVAAEAPAGAFTMTQKCVIANELCFVSRASAGGMSPEQRIDRVNERLAYILGYESLRPANIKIVVHGGGGGHGNGGTGVVVDRPDIRIMANEADIMVGHSLLTTVTPADARANGARNPVTLARIWATNLRRALPQARPVARLAVNRQERPVQIARRRVLDGVSHRAHVSVRRAAHY